MSSPGKHRPYVYKRAREHAERIEAELKALNVWQAEPPGPEAFESRKAFFADTMTFYQWLQWVLLKRIESIIAGRGEFPRSSSVGAYAVRELDGNWDAERLISRLCEFDGFIESVAEDEDDRDDDDDEDIEDSEADEEGFDDADEDDEDEDEEDEDEDDEELLAELDEEEPKEQPRKQPSGPVWQLSEVATAFLDSLPSLVYPELREIEQDEYGWRAHGIIVVKTRQAPETEFHVFLRFVRAAEGWLVDPEATLRLNTQTVNAYAAGLSRKVAEAFSKGDQAEAQRILQTVQNLLQQPPITKEMLTPEVATPAPAAPLNIPKLHIEPIRLGGVPAVEEAEVQPEEVAPAEARSYPPQPYDIPVQESYPEAAAVAESYLRALVTGNAKEFVAASPLPPSGRDLGMAERVFYSIKGFVQCFGEVELANEGPVVNALVEANRGVWAVRVAFLKRAGREAEPEEHLPSYFQPREKKKPKPKPEDLAEKLFVIPDTCIILAISV